MKNIWCCLLLLLLSVSFAFADEHVATVKQSEGKVVVEREGAVSALKAGDVLFASDSIRTGADSLAGFVFTDGTRIGMGASSQITIADYVFDPKDNAYAFDVYMQKGSAAYTSGKLGKLKPQAVQFRTPKATVGIRGTKFLVNVE